MATEYVRSHVSNENPIANPTLYWRVSGLALAAVAGLGILLSLMTGGKFIPGFLTFDWTHNILHVVLAGLALGMGFGGVDRSIQAGVAAVVGIVYLGLGIVGFMSGTIFGLGSLLGLHLEIGENLVHIAIGAWGTYAGFASGE